MTKNKILLLLTALVSVCGTGYAQVLTGKSHDDFANAVAIQALAVSAKRGGRFENAETAQVVWEGTILAIDVLALSSRRRSAEHLAGLVTFKLDGAVAQAYTCAVLRKRMTMLPLLRQLEKSTSETPCIQHAKLNDIPAETLCASSADVSRWVQSLIAPIKAGKQCGAN